MGGDHACALYVESGAGGLQLSAAAGRLAARAGDGRATMHVRERITIKALIRPDHQS